MPCGASSGLKSMVEAKPDIERLKSDADGAKMAGADGDPPIFVVKGVL